MHAAIYVRVSTDEQAQKGFSLAEQEAACRERAREIGASQVTVFADPGFSGELLDRPGLTALREAVRSGRVDCIVVRDADRLSRRLAHQLLLVQEFEKHNVRLEFLDFSWKDSPEGRLFYAVRGAIAEYEKEKIRERSMRGRLQKARQGGIPVLFDVYGYVYRPETGEVEVYEDEARVVRNLFQWFVQEDLSPYALAKRLNEQGVPTRRGARTWHENVVRRLLANPVYIGTWYYNRRDCAGRNLNRHLPRDQRVGLRPKPAEEWVPIPVPAIVDRWIWERAQQKLERARRLWAGKPRNRTLLAGLLVCADCGKPMHGAWMHADRTNVPAYTCRAIHAGITSGCLPQKKVRADWVNSAVWGVVESCLKDPDAVIRKMRELDTASGSLDELAAAQRALHTVERSRANVLEALSSGLLELDARTKGKLQELKRRRETLLARIEKLKAGIRTGSQFSQRIEEWKHLAQVTLRRLDQLSLDEKRALVRAVVERVEVQGRGSAVTLRVHLTVPSSVRVSVSEVAR